MANADDSLARYVRQLALPDFTLAAQEKLRDAHILVIGAGGLGAPALPYLAGAGVGAITLYDDDVVSITNLHRQTIYKNADEGQSKAELAAAYIQALNPDVRITVKKERFSALDSAEEYDLLIDGSDNFKTKSLLNALSIQNKIPLLSASVNQYAGQCGIFAGYASDMPCYHCLFPDLPTNARNCNEAGVIGTAAGITGLYQAHLAILFLAGLNDTKPGMFLSLDYKAHRLNQFSVPKNAACPHCAHNGKTFANNPPETEKKSMIELLSLEELQSHDHVIVDVRTEGEIMDDPIEGALHIELTQIPARHEELPKDKLLAFVCAGNIRSAKAAEYLAALGYDNVVVLDKFSI